MLTQNQIDQLKNDPIIKATVEANKLKAEAQRESELMLLGYNQALYEHDCHPDPTMNQERLALVIKGQREKLGL